MSYQDLLRPWVIYLRLPNLQRREMNRFRKRNEAEGYLKVLQRLTPDIEYEIVFEARQIAAIENPNYSNCRFEQFW
jgi:hypothetical protein